MATLNPCVTTFTSRLVGSGARRWPHFLRAVGESSGSEKELAAKLAAAEAEAQALRRELASRAGGRDVDLAKLKPSTPDKRVDGTGYRESLLTVPGEGEKPEEWGLTEANLSLQEESIVSEEKAEEENDNGVVTRRLLIGVGLSAAALVLAFFKPPPGLIKPPKPLPFYLLRILQLKQQLLDLEQSTLDTRTVLSQLERVYRSAGDWKDTLLSAAAWLEGDAADKASALALDIYDYLEQADYNRYFDTIGPPSEADLLQFVRFSVQATKAARDLIQEFLSYVPKDTLREAEINQSALMT